MKFKTIFISIMVLVLSASVVFAQKDPIAVIVKASGDVGVQYQKEGKRIKLKRGSKIYDGAIVIAKEKSYAALIFTDDRSQLRIRPNSILTVNGTREKNSIAKNIAIEVGTIFAEIAKQKTEFRVTTPTSVASVKGTSFWVQQKYKAGTYYYGEEGGPTEVTNKAGSALFRAGETCFVSSENSKPIVRKTKPGEKPEFDEENSIDEFQLDFKNEEGDTKTLRFKTKTKK